jgi:serine/threonine-protein phosphatase 5|uniref:protein-serine/threonine phosphatase n=1 Tax=Eutreptiella gymnastica TaxID=73025 RepID=A0A7S4FNT6_9EUGL|eukprot:CAMPEP_0174286492 /NCGR_PEP_ID=MMETSP0809-20121228/12127_1 /TAXON_ID=73025 ORGANISM="Eutreptiella gymnastica-like, Strain CCMP1594" /NCGR_SAMPLE_ID=MMETSP0809 /ASSEMBLY_ACC=CAM_ASM_000658 /LENGTH=477 /DNA_ID=CAMNT_0015382593 /DNA_START=23 /DNA_END=1456 /DNA_ORIENTATION=+
MAESDVETQAAKFKEEGNTFFKAFQFPKAIDAYTKCLELDDKNVAVYCNRAFAHLKVEAFGSALEDANVAIDLDPAFVKAYYRRATAYLALGKNEEALKDLKRVVTIVPKDKDAKLKYQSCEKQVKQMRFAKAIESEETQPVSQTIKLDDIVVSDSYAGPRLEGDITKEFVLELMSHLKEQKSLHKKYAIKIMLEARKTFGTFPPLVDVTVPDDKTITVCGDIHGQYYDLMNIFENLNGLPSEENPYLFNGDFVDRGSFSLECILVLLCWKVLLPNHFFMSRGNHEGRNLNKVYGFEGEVKHKLDEKCFALFSEIFDWLPLCHVVNNRVFCVHGGLFSKDGVTLDDIRKINRNRDIPDEGLMCEMLWSDPSPIRGRHPNKRGVGVAFGPDVTEEFLKTNGLELVIRSHEVKDEGYEVDHGGKLITVFSAPNYCDQIGNKGAFIRLNGKEMKPQFTTYDAVEHPAVKPMQYSMFPGMS